MRTSDRPSSYMFIALETAVLAYSVATSQVVRTLQPMNGHSIIGYKLSPNNQEHLYIFTSAGSISKWNWVSGEQLSRLDTDRHILFVELTCVEFENNSHILFYFLRERTDGMREITVLPSDGQLSSDHLGSEYVILESHVPITGLKVASQSFSVVAYGGERFLTGTHVATESEVRAKMHYTWREVSLPTAITSLDIQCSSHTRSEVSRNGRLADMAIALGQADGSILIYHDILSSALDRKGNDGVRRGVAPRRLHWHRGRVSTIRWSKDGMSLGGGAYGTFANSSYR